MAKLSDFLFYEEPGITLYCGDCREVLPLKPRESVDVLLTDPPYGVSVAGSVSIGPNGSRRLDFFPNDDPALALESLTAARDVLRRPCNVFSFLAHRQFGAVETFLSDLGLTTKPWVWLKKYPPPAAPGMRWVSAAEIAIFAFDAGAYFRDAGAGVRPNYWLGDSYRYGQPGKVSHPTQKPLVLVTDILATLTPPRGIVLDPFCGSGTTLIAAKNLARRVIGIEIEPRYCEIAVKRLRQEVLSL